jgi:hypothetical protein
MKRLTVPRRSARAGEKGLYRGKREICDGAGNIRDVGGCQGEHGPSDEARFDEAPPTDYPPRCWRSGKAFIKRITKKTTTRGIVSPFTG